ncbi:hypothetical protein C210_00587 [Klebsiella pneumoniae subsp. pneumoniae KpMDU1]|nr:hypothetical protein C210_00587 [Klebsiella pneumoniae subsp. pneumoniae KpMDU1]
MSALGADTAASRGKSLFLETASKPEDLPEYVALVLSSRANDKTCGILFLFRMLLQ